MLVLYIALALSHGTQNSKRISIMLVFYILLCSIQMHYSMVLKIVKAVTSVDKGCGKRLAGNVYTVSKILL